MVITCATDFSENKYQKLCILLSILFVAYVCIRESDVMGVRTPRSSGMSSLISQNDRVFDVPHDDVSRHTIPPIYLRSQRESNASAGNAITDIYDHGDQRAPYRPIPRCPDRSALSVGRRRPSSIALSMASIRRRHGVALVSGGSWSPSSCRPHQKLALIVPYKNRQRHLRLFLAHMHPFLKRQLAHYRIFVVEQSSPSVFNKAYMMNIAFKEVSKIDRYDCYIFHDIDMLPEDDRHVYRCNDSVIHLGAFVDKFGYQLLYTSLFGGAVAFRDYQFEAVNGYSTLYFGWGGEDDDMYNRVTKWRNFLVTRPDHRYGKYKMMKHKPDKNNPRNPQRRVALGFRPEEYAIHGLRSTKYTIQNYQEKPLYTWIYASIDAKQKL